MPKNIDATPEEQNAMRAIWPNGLPRGSMNERIEREARSPHPFIARVEDAQCAVLACDKPAADPIHADGGQT